MSVEFNIDRSIKDYVKSSGHFFFHEIVMLIFWPKKFTKFSIFFNKILVHSFRILKNSISTKRKKENMNPIEIN